MSNSPDTGRAEFLELDRIPELDGVRGLALVMVLWLHCFLFVPTNLLTKLANSIGGSMFIALDLFFVLSGFLITGILIRTRDAPHCARNFYVRRVLRIFPAYYFTLIVIFFIYPLFYEPLRESGVIRESPYFFLYIQNFYLAWKAKGGDWPGVDHLWSMAVEEQFYLLWPLVVWFTPPARLWQVCVGAIAFSVGLKLVLLIGGTTIYDVYLPTWCRLEGLAAGAALAAMWQTHRIYVTPAWLRAIGLVATACLLFLIFRKYTAKAGSPKDITAHVVLSTAAFSWMIYAAVTSDPRALIRRFFRSRALCFLGRYSYGIYLLHYVVYWQIKYFILGKLEEPLGANTASTIAGIAIVAATIALALVMYRFIEAPALSLKRYFTSREPVTAGNPS